MRKLTLKKPINSEEKIPKNIPPWKKREKKEEKEDEFELKDINKYKLDDEASKHDSLYRIAARKYAEASRLKYELELELSIKKDELAQDMAKYPKQWGLTDGKKLSDALINRLITRDKEYLEIQDRYIQARAQQKEWEGVKQTLEQRGWMIKLLYEMWEKNYY